MNTNFLKYTTKKENRENKYINVLETNLTGQFSVCRRATQSKDTAGTRYSFFEVWTLNQLAPILTCAIC